MRIILVGDTAGVEQLLRFVPRANVVALLGAAIRPQYLPELESIAARLGVSLLVQPKRGADEYAAFVNRVVDLEADLLWANSYSMILREDLLASVRLGAVNIHAALLPHNRGCNPTQWAIINGDGESGVTLHEVSEGVDEGPIIDQRRLPLFFEDTWQTVRARLMRASDELIAANLPAILSGRWVARPQDEAVASSGRRRTPEDGLFDWSQPVVSIYNHIRALLPPLPPAFFVDPDGRKVVMEHYLRPAEVAMLKYGRLGGQVMQAGRVRLRPLQPSDGPLLYEWITNRDLVILNFPYSSVLEGDHQAWVDSMLTKRSDLVAFIVDETAGSGAIGTCQLVNINWRHRSAELQVRIGSATHQGKGFRAEAVKLLCRFGFTDLKLHRIYLHVFANDLGAIRAYEKCGFVREGLLKEAAFIDGTWVDVRVMGLIERDE